VCSHDSAPANCKLYWNAPYECVSACQVAGIALRTVGTVGMGGTVCQMNNGKQFQQALSAWHVSA